MAEEKTLKTMYNEVIANANAVVVAMNEHKPQKEVKALKKVCKESVDLYNDRLAKAYYIRLSTEHGHDAVKVALEAEETAIPDAIGISFKVTDDDVALFSENKPVVKMNLVKMQQAIGPEYFHSKDWFARVNVLARLMAVALNEELGGSATFQYILDESAKEFKLSADADPKSVKSMVKAFQQVIDDVLWIDTLDKSGNHVNGIKFTSKQWAYIRDCMSKQGGKIGEVLYGSPAKCTELVADCIHLILTNKGCTLKVG